MPKLINGERKPNLVFKPILILNRILNVKSTMRINPFSMLVVMVVGILTCDLATMGLQGSLATSSTNLKEADDSGNATESKPAPSPEKAKFSLVAANFKALPDSELLTAAINVFEELERRFDVEVSLPGEKLCNILPQEDEDETEMYDDCLKAFGIGDTGNTSKGLDGIRYLVAVTTATENDDASSSENQSAVEKDRLGNFEIQPLMSDTNEGDEGGEDNDSVAQKDLDDQDKQGNFEIQDLLRDKKNTTLR